MLTLLMEADSTKLRQEHKTGRMLATNDEALVCCECTRPAQRCHQLEPTSMTNACEIHAKWTGTTNSTVTAHAFPCTDSNLKYGSESGQRAARMKLCRCGAAAMGLLVEQAQRRGQSWQLQHHTRIVGWLDGPAPRELRAQLYTTRRAQK